MIKPNSIGYDWEFTHTYFKLVIVITGLAPTYCTLMFIVIAAKADIDQQMETEITMTVGC